jgi:hypothetical protein
MAPPTPPPLMGAFWVTKDTGRARPRDEPQSLRVKRRRDLFQRPCRRLHSAQEPADQSNNPAPKCGDKKSFQHSHDSLLAMVLRPLANEIPFLMGSGRRILTARDRADTCQKPPHLKNARISSANTEIAFRKLRRTPNCRGESPYRRGKGRPRSTRSALNWAQAGARFKRCDEKRRSIRGRRLRDDPCDGGDGQIVFVLPTGPAEVRYPRPSWFP